MSDSATLKGAAGIAGATAMAQGAAALSSPVFTRLYSPDDFGVFAVFSSMLGVAIIVGSLRFELAVPIVETEDQARQILVLCAIVIGLSAALTTVLVATFGPWAAEALGVPALAPYMWLLPVALLGGSTYQALSYYALRRRSYRRVAVTKVTQGIAGILVTMFLGFMVAGPLGLLLGAVASHSAGVVSLSRELRGHQTPKGIGLSIAELRGLARRFSKFPKLSVPSSLMNRAALTLVPLLMATLFGAASAGKYSLSMRVVALPVVIVGEAVRQTFLGEASAASRDPDGKIWPLMARATKSLLPFSASVLLLGAVSPLFFGRVFGDEWSDAGIYAAILGLLGASQLLVSPVSTVTILLERQEVQFGLDLLRAVMVLVSLLTVSALGMGDLAGLIAFVASMTVVYGLTFLTCRRLAIAHDIMPPVRMPTH